MANWVSKLAAGLEAIADANNQFVASVRLHGRYGSIVREMREFHRYWTMENGGGYYATSEEVRLVGSTTHPDFSWMCTQASNSVVGMMYLAIVQANNGNKTKFVEKSRAVVARLDVLIQLETPRQASYKLMRQKWINFHNAEVKRLK